jgi:hypothetical protein
LWRARQCSTCRGWQMVIYSLKEGEALPVDPNKCPECGACVGYKALRGVSMAEL